MARFVALFMGRASWIPGMPAPTTALVVEADTAEQVRRRAARDAYILAFGRSPQLDDYDLVSVEAA